MDRAHRIDTVFMDPLWGVINYDASGRERPDLAPDMRTRGWVLAEVLSW